jgi:hypothetical protein
MHRSLAAVVLAGTLALSPAANANLLTNPGFETGNFTGWTQATGGSAVGLCLPLVMGCAPGGGQYIASLRSTAAGANVSVLQTAPSLPAGTYEFGATVAFFTDVVGGNFDQGQISLTVQGAGVSSTIGRDPNSLAAQFIPLANGFFYTFWFDLTGTLVYDGAAPADFLINLNVQNFPPSNTIELLVDNVFLRAVSVPEPASLALLGAGLLGLAAFRRRRV